MDRGELMLKYLPSGRRVARTSIWCVALIGTFVVSALGQYEPPSDYYATVTGNVATLKSELRLIMGSNYWTSRAGGTFVPNGYGHYIRSYDDARYGLQIVDSSPNDTSKVVLAYNGQVVTGAWDQGDTWNREHRWPKSIGLGTSGADYSDMHHLKACNPSVNSSRGNTPYGTPTSTGTYGTISSSWWFPGDLDVPSTPEFGNDTGDVARMAFYMAVRYDGTDTNTVDLELKTGANGTNQLGDLAAFLAWHYKDLPTAYERRRNHLIFSNVDNPDHYQGNRNAFIDHPEYVWAIFGDGANDSKLYVGGSAPANGTSCITVDFGTVMVGAAVPAAQTVTLTKAGTDPTYYEVTSSGVATCNVSGRNNAFPYNAGSKTLTISLPAGITTTPGLKTGTVVIDNLDWTNQGTGTGSLDGNDTIQVQLMVGSCPTPFADNDGDGDVDQTDFAALQLCFSGDSAAATDCYCFDRDGTGTVNDLDFAAFEACYTGPGVTADPTCGD
jgi:endonuclease I